MFEIVVILFLIAFAVVGFIARQGREARKKEEAKAVLTEPVVIKWYRGDQKSAAALFQVDSTEMATKGYFPVSQSWAPGEWGAGAFVTALLLCLVVIGILVFIYMLVVKPDGTLTVTYRQRAAEKTCPRCAEQIKAAALVCHFCGYEF
jgi:hypothetical protein